MLTTILDLIGLLLLVLALAVVGWSMAAPPAGIAAGGVGVLAVSWLVDRRAP